MPDDMPPHIQARLYVFREDDGEIGEEQIERVFDKIIQAIESEGMCVGGSMGSPLSEERRCAYCDGDGLKPVIEDHTIGDICPTCAGTGRLEEDDTEPMSKEEWEETYDAPVAQGTEQLFPKQQVEGSSPSGSAKNDADHR